MTKTLEELLGPVLASRAGAALLCDYEIDLLGDDGWVLIAGFGDESDAWQAFNRVCGTAFEHDPRASFPGDFDYRLRHGGTVLAHACFRLTVPEQKGNLAA